MAPTRRKIGGKKNKNTIKYTWGIHSLTRKRMKTHRKKKKRSSKKRNSQRRRRKRGRKRKGGTPPEAGAGAAPAGEAHQDANKKENANHEENSEMGTPMSAAEAPAEKAATGLKLPPNAINSETAGEEKIFEKLF